MHANVRHLRLISVQTARHAVRGGAGLVFLLMLLVFGLTAAQIILAPVELIAKRVERAGAPADSQHAVSEVLESARPVVRWALGGKFSDAPTVDPRLPGAPPAPATVSPHDRWAAYLLNDRPGLLSAIFILLTIGVPLLVPFVGFNQVSGDAQSRGLRYLLLRTERGNIFLGRFLGTALFALFVLAFLVAVVTFYLGMRIGIYSPGALLSWGMLGFAALALLTLPYVALTSAVSASIDSPFLSLVVNSLLIGGLPLFAWIASVKWEYAGYLKYLLPWGVQNHLLHPDPMHVLGAAAACLGYTIGYLLLGYRYFEVRDL